MKVHLSNEEIEVTKEPYVKEEVMMKKKHDTETIAVEDSATSKKFDLQSLKKNNR
jgi:stress response protein YsnF